MPKSLAEALGGGHDDGSGGDDAKPDYNEHGKAAMGELISAIASKDAAAAWEAFKTVSDLCGHDDEPDGDEGGKSALMLIPHGK
jgi:hypothetical protein